MDMGGGVTPIATQTTNPGNFQLLSGLTRFVTTTNGAATGEFGVYALGDIVLNAAAAGGNPNTKITMLARTGGVDVKGIGGSISIMQTDTAVTNISNIVIENIALGDKENIVKFKQLSESSPSTIKKLIDGYNIYNLMLFYFAHLYISSSNFQVFLLISSVVIYIISYIVFYNIRKRS